MVDTPLSDPSRTRGPGDELQPFGYELFAGRPTTFAPVTEIPLPSLYIVGPGDVIKLQLYGNVNRSLELPVTRDGTIQLEEAGPVVVAGQTFEQVRQVLERRVRETYLGTEASITLGELRSMRVFVLGEARHPGSYTVSSLSTMTNALLVSGGVKTSGSLRQVQLKRQGEVIGTLDLYQLLLAGDTSSDQRLQSGDTLFIPPVGDTVAVDGEVQRPAIYELKGNETLADMVAMAGGYKRDAAPAHSQLERVDERRRRTLETLDLTRAYSQQQPVREGDRLTINSLQTLTDGFVHIRGEAERPGKRQWRPGMRLSDLLQERRSALPEDADLNYGLIVRELNHQQPLQILQFSPSEIFRSPGSEQDLQLQERDQILLFSQQDRSEGSAAPVPVPGDQAPPELTGRELLNEVLARLDQQATPARPVRAASVAGAVRYPGRYPLGEGATARELIAAAGGLQDSALTLEAEVVRSSVSEGGEADTELLRFALFQGVEDGAGEIRLHSYDRLLIKSVPGFAEREVITLEGELRFPGEYSIRPGDTLTDLIERAGGFTQRAFMEGAVFSRERLRQLEQERMAVAEQRLRRDLLGLQLTAGEETSREDLVLLQGLLQEVQGAEPLGRLVIDLVGLEKGRLDGLEVLDGDHLRVPRRPQSVSVFGEVQFASSHLYDPGLSVTDYLDRSGGFTAQSDEQRVYIIRADGSVWRPRSSRWFAGGGEQIRPGDTIVAPIKVDRINQLQLATNISQIFSNLAVSAAALRSL
ncbi:MAG: sugar transporter [Halomonadaceae bacterium]|nr:MAG: sugar transporter [Halomonadaceae bacterium]